MKTLIRENLGIVITGTLFVTMIVTIVVNSIVHGVPGLNF